MGDQTQRVKQSAHEAAGGQSLCGQKTRAGRAALRRVAANLGGLLVLLTCLGCGSKLPATKPVTGTVTYLGQPVEGATVMFGRDSRDIAKGELAIGKTDAQGRFALSTHFGSETDAKGVVAGDYAVTISKLVPPPGIAPPRTKPWSMPPTRSVRPGACCRRTSSRRLWSSCSRGLFGIGQVAVDGQGNARRPE